jgi:hypothetical protein
VGVFVGGGGFLGVVVGGGGGLGVGVGSFGVILFYVMMWMKIICFLLENVVLLLFDKI